MPQDQEEPSRSEGRLSQLSIGERACLALAAQGMVSKQIARELDLSPHTVDDRIRSACRKLGARNRLHAAQIYTLEISQDNSDTSLLTSRLRHEDSDIPAAPQPGDKGASAGEGDGSDDLRSRPGFRPEARASGADRSWLESSHPLAKFLGGENRLSIGRRLLLIVAIAIATGILFTALVNSYVTLSQMLSPP
jgi:DNA-binding CsgD family transcriptional regulator